MIECGAHALLPSRSTLLSGRGTWTFCHAMTAAGRRKGQTNCNLLRTRTETTRPNEKRAEA